MEPYFPGFRDALVISIAEAAFDVARAHQDPAKLAHARVVVERSTAGQVPKFSPDAHDPESDALVALPGEEASDEGLYDPARELLVMKRCEEDREWVDPELPSRVELAAAAAKLVAAMPSAVREAAKRDDLFGRSLPPTNLFRSANAGQRGTLVLVSVGAERRHGGWLVDGRYFVPESHVPRYARDLRAIKRAERVLGRPLAFSVTETVPGWWIAEAAGPAGEALVKARAWTEYEARALLIVLRVYARAAGLMHVDEQLA